MSKELRLNGRQRISVYKEWRRENPDIELDCEASYLLKMLDAQIAHVLSALAETKDEWQILEVAKWIADWRCRAVSGGVVIEWDKLSFDAKAFYQEKARDILALIIPILRARAEKEKAEAVEEANKLFVITLKILKEAVNKRQNVIDNMSEEIKKRAEQARKEVFEGTLQFHVADRDTLQEVGEWAECQAAGVFVWFPSLKWQALKEVKERRD